MRAHFKIATLLDQDGRPIVSTRCDARRQADGTVKHRRRVRFPPSPRDCVAVAVKLSAPVQRISVAIPLTGGLVP